MRHRLLPLVLAAAALAIAATAATAHATAAKVHVTGGRTALIINPAILPALTHAGVGVAPIAPATAAPRTWGGKPTAVFKFPISHGRLGATTLRGTIDHTGGLTFSHGSASLSVGLFRIANFRQAYLTGAVNLDNSIRVTLFKLDLSRAQVVTRGHTVHVNGVRARLTRGAAAALDESLGTHVFSRGLLVGVANVTAVIDG